MENKFISLINKNNCGFFKKYFNEILNKLDADNAECVFCGFSEEGSVNLKFCVGNKIVVMLSAGDYNCNAIEYLPFPKTSNFDHIWLSAFGEFMHDFYPNYFDDFIDGFCAFRRELVEQKLQQIKRELDEQTLELQTKLYNIKNGLK